MNLRRKLLLGALPAVILLTLLGAYGVYVIEHLGGQAENILRANYRSIVVVQQIFELTGEVERLFLSPDVQASPEQVGRLANAAFEPLSRQQGNITEPTEQEVTAHLARACSLWAAAARQAAARPTPAAQVEAYLELVRPRLEEVRAAGDEIVRLNQQAIVRKSRETNALAVTLRRRLVVASTAALGTLLILAVLGARRISRPVVELTRAVRAVGRGELERPLPLPRGHDEVATLVEEFRRMAEALREYRRSSLGELIAAQQLAQGAIDSLREPVLSVGPDGRVRQVNGAALELLGVDPDAQDPLGRVPAELRRRLEGARDHVFAGRGAVVPEGLAATPAMVQGRARQLQVHATPVVERAGGEIVGVTILVRDVTSLHAAAALKDDLLSTVAHELRTPLTSLRMALHMTLEQVAGPLGEKQQELLGAARDDAERLHALVEGILAVSRLEGGGLAARRRRVSPAELVDAVTGPARVTAADRQLELATDAPAEPACFVDAESAVIALGNLLQNALRHSPDGGRVSVRAFPTRQGQVRFEVGDQGPGIAPEHQARLFSRFYRVPGTPAGGTGLGLSITRDIVHAHGGEVGVESAPGAGSTFWFTLPCAQPEPASAPAG